MNIIYIAYSCNPFNGTEDKIGWYIPYYASKYNKVFIITKEESREYINKFIKNESCQNISVYYIDIPQIYKKIYKGSLYSVRLNIWNKRAFKIVMDICNNQKIDIIHQVNPVEFRSIGAYGKIKNIPFVCGPIGGGEYVPKPLRKYIENGWSIEVIRLIANYYYKVKYKINGRFDECDKLLFANFETRNFLFGSLKQEKYDVITELGSLKQEKNVNSSKNDKFTILSGGRLIYRKGFNLLLDAIEYIPSEYDFEVKLVGDGPQYRKLKKRVEKSNVLKNRIEMLGRVPHMKMESLYKMSNIFIMPSLRETTGSVIIEALENGIPVLAANMFGAKIILDDKCGLLYNIDEKEEVSERLANLIKKCIKNEIKVKNMTNDCLEKAKELSFENKIKKYEKIYSELCEKNSQNEE